MNYILDNIISILNFIINFFLALNSSNIFRLSIEFVKSSKTFKLFKDYSLLHLIYKTTSLFISILK